MRYNLLGTFEIVTDKGWTHTPGTPKMCQVLALLLMRAGRVVSADSLIQELWGNEPPSSAVTTLQTYVYHSRRMLERTGITVIDRPRLHTQSPGYWIEAATAEVDAKLFELMVEESRTLLDHGRAECAWIRLREAAGLWRGPILAGITAGSVLTGYITLLDELRVSAIEMRIEASEHLGKEREIVPELRSLVAGYPLNESFHARLITVLSRSGRRVEALHAYDDLRRILSEELGLEPSPELVRIKQEVLGLPPAPPPLSLVNSSGRILPRRRSPFRA